MLEELRIRDLGVITDATLPLGPGLSVVTGETGAGKTMVVTAVGLLLGARSDAGAVRSGAKSASAEAVLKLDAGHAAVAGPARPAPRSRSSTAARNCCWPAASAPTAAAAPTLAAVPRRSACSPRSARPWWWSTASPTRSGSRARWRSASALDKFAGESLAGTLAAYQELHGHWKASQAELDALRSAARERLREAESLEAALAEIDAVDPQPGEDESLKAEAVETGQRRGTADRGHARRTRRSSPRTSGRTADATTLVDAAKRTLEHVAEHDEELGSAAARLAEVGFLLNDIAARARQLPGRPGYGGPGAARRDRGPAGGAGETGPQVRAEHRRGAGLGRGGPGPVRGTAGRLHPDRSAGRRGGPQPRPSSGSRPQQSARPARRPPRSSPRRVSAELKALAMADATLVINVEPGGAAGPVRRRRDLLPAPAALRRPGPPAGQGRLGR